MADRYLLESSLVDGYLLEDGSGVLLLDANAAPTITTQPTNQSTTVGNTATFTGAADGTPTPSLQWQYLDTTGPSEVIDDFNRADGALGANWEVEVGAAAIASNAISFTGEMIARYVGRTFAADQEAEVVIGSPGSSHVGGAVRVQNTGGGYFTTSEFDSTYIVVYRRDSGGSYSEMHRVTGLSLVSGDRIGLRVSGSTFSIILNGTAIGTSFTDTLFSTGQPGIYGFSSTSTEWSADDYVPQSAWTDVSTGTGFTTGTWTTATQGTAGVTDVRLKASNTTGTVYSNTVTLTVTAGGSYTLTAQGGSYAMTGGSAVLERDRRLTASGGSYTVTGGQAGVTYSAGAINYNLTALGGAYTFAGASAVLIRNRRLTSSGGAYTITGATVTIQRDRMLTASGGTYTVLGGDRSSDCWGSAHRSERAILAHRSPSQALECNI